MKLHVDGGRASAQQLKSVVADSDRNYMHVLHYADEMPEPCDVCGASAKAPQTPIAGASAVSMYNQNSHTNLLSPGELSSLRATNVVSGRSEGPQARSENPHKDLRGLNVPPSDLDGLRLLKKFEMHFSPTNWHFQTAQEYPGA